MQTLLVFPDPPPPELTQCLDKTGWKWKSVVDAEMAAADQPDDGWTGAVVVADANPEAALTLCQRLKTIATAQRKRTI